MHEGGTVGGTVKQSVFPSFWTGVRPECPITDPLTPSLGPGLAPGLFREEAVMTIWSLYYGRRRTPLARVVPDEKYPTMWRIHWPSGEVSDMVNLTRAKDAATAIALRGMPGNERRLFNWKAG